MTDPRMFIEQLILTNFRCWIDSTTIDLSSGLTAFVGINGAGKTAVWQALQRLFGITEINVAFAAKTVTYRPQS